MKISDYSRRDFLGAMGYGMAALTLPGCLRQMAQSQARSRPNIVIIFADDMGYGDPSCYNDQSKIPTPYIDKLASQGMHFTDAHTAAAVCTPSRYGLLTGRYCWRSRLKSGVLWQWDEPLIEPGRLTLPGMLQESDYHTGCVGKWHLGWDWPTTDGSRISETAKMGTWSWNERIAFGNKVDFSKPIEDGPITRGFDYYFGDDVPNFPPYCFIENDRVIKIPASTKPKNMFGNPGPAMADWQLDEVMPKLTTQAVKYLEQRSQNPEQPFFLYFSLTAPHTPISPVEPFIGKSQAGLYGDYVHQVDATVGGIMQVLERTGQADNTLLIFTSDNGSPQRDGTNMSGEIGSVKERFGHDPSRPWRGMKGDIWEGGHRVPFIARWAGVVNGGAVSDEVICQTDLFATIGAIAGYELPDEETAEDSYNILPVLQSRKIQQPIRQSIIHHSLNGTFAIRQGPWKLIMGKKSGGFTKYEPPADAPVGQLYNLAEDPAESNNLYIEHPEIVDRLTKLLQKYKTQHRSRAKR